MHCPWLGLCRPYSSNTLPRHVFREDIDGKRSASVRIINHRLPIRFNRPDSDFLLTICLRGARQFCKKSISTFCGPMVQSNDQLFIVVLLPGSTTLLFENGAGMCQKVRAFYIVTFRGCASYCCVNSPKDTHSSSGSNTSFFLKLGVICFGLPQRFH